MTTIDEGVAADHDAAPKPGEMSLADHLRELRSRLIKSAIAIVLGMIVGWVFFDPIYAFLSAPINAVIADAQAQGRDIQVVVLGITDPFTLKMKISATVGLVLAARCGSTSCGASSPQACTSMSVVRPTCSRRSRSALPRRRGAGLRVPSQGP